MMVSVIRYPDNKKPRAFPQVTQLYDRYLTKNNINDVAVSFHGGTFNTLEHAAMVSHAEVIKICLRKEQKIMIIRLLEMLLCTTM